MTAALRDPHAGQPVLTDGAPISEARLAIVLVHGRGATAESILELARGFQFPHVACLAPQASGNTWYPYSFLAPIPQNEPGITSGLRVLGELIERIGQQRLGSDRVVLLGFSQGACLALEYAARNVRRYAGVVGLSGGLIGPPGTPRDYTGSFDGTPVFLGCSDVDSHIPLARVHETADVFRRMGAIVDERIYRGMAHTVIPDEIEAIAGMIQTSLIVNR